jgi:hypothetical protein
MLNETVIPITYAQGTGGNFLCHFLVSAKNNNKSLLKFSTYGNAHTSLTDFPSPVDQSRSDIEKINIIHRIGVTLTTGKQPPYFTSIHIFDSDLVNSHFKKSIRITYDLDDINEIGIVSYGKCVNSPGVFKDSTTLEELISKVQRDFIYFKPENFSNILSISWKELFKENIEDLISKLSLFTSIDNNNFSRESIIQWRAKTQYGIDSFAYLTSQ